MNGVMSTYPSSVLIGASAIRIGAQGNGTRTSKTPIAERFSNASRSIDSASAGLKWWKLSKSVRIPANAGGTSSASTGSVTYSTFAREVASHWRSAAGLGYLSVSLTLAGQPASASCRCSGLQGPAPPEQRSTISVVPACRMALIRSGTRPACPEPRVATNCR